MKRTVLLACAILISLFFAILPEGTVYAVTANPNPVRFVQPDGSSLTILLKGDEFIHWAVTPDGYTLLSNKKGGYEYATLSSEGKMGFSGILANDPDNRGQQELSFLSKTQKGIFFTKPQISEMKQALKAGHSPSSPLTGGFPTTGLRKLLVILANFSNTTTTYTQTNFNNYMNQVNYNGTGSFKDYYLEVSYGQLVVNTTVTVWVTLPNTHDYYGPSSMWGQFALDAITAANNQTSINFADFDNNADGTVDGVAIFHQGQGQEETGNINDIWSHSWELSSAGFTVTQRTFDGVLVDSYTTMPERNSSGMGTIGVMCHEFGHNLGAPDFYDTDYSTNGQYDGTSNWDIMASGSWNGNSGDKPAHHNAYTKAYIYGWTTPTILTTAQTKTLRNAKAYQDVVRYNTSTANEYFLCENRQQIGFDAGIPGHGLIVFHVDGNYITAHSSANDINAGSHQGLYPVCATATGNPPTVYGTINGGGCPFPGTGSKASFSDATTPNSHSWAGASTNLPLTNITENTTAKEITFCFIACVPTLAVTPSNQSVTPPSGNIPFTVTSNAAWTASSNQSWCTVTPSGTGNGTLYTSFTQNTGTSARVANITVIVATLTPVVVTVTQASPSLAVTPSNQTVTSSSGTAAFAVAANTNWTATSNQSWCTITPSGSGNGTITATYSENLTFFQRTANVTVSVTGLAPVVVTLTQEAAAIPIFHFTIANDVQTSDRTLEFDLYLLNTQPVLPIELSMIQPGILVNSEIINGGTITPFIISGSSELVSAQQPSSISWASATPSGCIKIAARPLPGCGKGTIIKTTGQGTRICRVRITNSVAFTSGSRANLDFNFASTPASFLITKVYQYTGTPCTSNLMTSNPLDCYSIATNPILNGPPSLSVSPSNQSVSSSSGSTSFTVNSNASWTATSNQGWCTVTSSGFGAGTILTNYTENTTSSPRVANITVTVAGLTPIIVTVTQAAPSIKTLNLSSVFFEGLYNGAGTMFQAQDENGPHWPDGSADHISIELHNSTAYSTIEYTVTDVPLSTTGTAFVTIPAEKNGSYYITIRHRNSLETTSAVPVSFSGSAINYAFNTKDKAFGSNMTFMMEADGITFSPPLIFGGDVNQDGQVEAEDINPVGNDAAVFAIGYILTDVYCDGQVEAQDMNITGNNAAAFVIIATP